MHLQEGFIVFCFVDNHICHFLVFGMISSLNNQEDNNFLIEYGLWFNGMGE
jgi:hypothetical protein